jgi:membrane associated rhomboid family serine protease
VGARLDPLMFVPLHDDTPLKIIRFQFVTVAIILVNVGVFLATTAFADERAQVLLAGGFGVVPGEIVGIDTPWFSDHPVPRLLTLVTYMFLHGGWLHLVSNMVFLWVFGDNIEDAFGPLIFALFYLLCGIMAALVHVMADPTSVSPLIGASGAISGVLAAYLLLYPRARVWILLFMRLPVRIGAVWVLLGWFLLQVYALLMTGGQHVEVAFWAHAGGFITGLALTIVLRSRLLVRTGE